VDVDLENVHFKSSEADLEKFLGNYGITVNDVEYELDARKNNRFTGKAFLVLDFANAEKLIGINGTKFWDRKLKIIVVKPADHVEPVEDIPVVNVIHQTSKEEVKVNEVKPSQTT